MKRTLVRLLLFLLAAVAGWGASELLFRMQRGRELIARFVESEAAIRIEKNLRDAASAETVADAEVEHETELFRDQFGDDGRFNEALRAANLSLGELRNHVAEHLRARVWIEKQIAPQVRIGDEPARAYYERNRPQFMQPLRYRARHLFVAAPNGSPQEVIFAKLSEIEGLSVRRLSGEEFPALIAEASEDEATKTRGGDLNYFSAARMPPEFLEELKKLQVGEISGPVRSHLGFHLVQLTETKPEREMSFEEARPEIARALANQRRALAVAALHERLSTPEFRRD